jgi:hypothetical protein
MSLPSHPGHYQKEPQLLAELVIPAMLELARTTEDDMARGIAIGNLLGLGEKAGPAVPGLVDLVGDDRALPHLANGAGKLGAHAKKLVPAFQGRLGDSSPTVRRNAAEGLGQIGPDAASATDALAKVLTSDDDAILAREGRARPRQDRRAREERAPGSRRGGDERPRQRPVRGEGGRRQDPGRRLTPWRPPGRRSVPAGRGWRSCCS